jgi:hypothetical protein
MKINERQLRKLQKQRHMYDIQQMILANPMFKNLNKRDQSVLAKLIYRAEMTEMFMRDRNVVRMNQSFEQIVGQVLDMLDESMVDQDGDDDDYDRRNRDFDDN